MTHLSASARITTFTPGMLGPRFPTTVAVVLLLSVLAASLDAQVMEKIELEDSRGEAVVDALTIGRSLYVHLHDAPAGQRYRYALSTASGDLVDEAVATAEATGSVPTTGLFFKSHIGDYRCRPGGTVPSGGSGDLYGPFTSPAEASAALDGLTLWFTAEVELPGAAGGPSSWSPILIQPITMVETIVPHYYWSDAAGHARCFFRKDERDQIHLSVYRGELAGFPLSRVFVLERPAKSEWKLDFEFEDIRYEVGCTTTPTDDCTYSNGTEETLPSTTTIPIQGQLPEIGAFLAVIRDVLADDEPKIQPFDRATEDALRIEEEGQLTQNQEGWGCPPCASN